MNSWRETQKSFVSEKVEFVQDQRILDFFDNSVVHAVGDVEYFHDKLNIKESDSYTQALLIVNTPTSNLELTVMLESIKNIDRVCVSINKFLLWTQTNRDDVTEDYDTALLELIKSIFKNRNVQHFYVKGVKGRHFNFASPTTQFFITNENN